MNYILAFIVFSGVITAGNALTCVTCKVVERGGTIPDNCDGELVECDESTSTCATQIEQNNVDGDLITTVSKRCFPLKDKGYCERRFELNAREIFYLSVFTNCCDEDGCNTDPIQLPPENTVPNGLKCPVCFEEDSVTCTPTEKECFGDQLQCIDFRGLAARPEEDAKNYAIQGCLTLFACYLDFDGLPGTRVISKDYTCTPPPLIK
nr:sodefrin precursor-like factor B [Lithobates vaillanti]